MSPDRVASARNRLLPKASATVGIILLLVLWQLAAVVFAERHVVPGPLRVLEQMWSDRGYLASNSGVTIREAMVGYLWGNGAAVALAVLFVQLHAAERLLLRLAIASYCVPLVAIAPVLVVVLPGDGPKYALAALAVFFTTLIATLVGLRSSDATSIEVIRASGGTKWQAMRYVSLRAALPSTFAGLCIAAPAALLGAIIGEYLGASNGLGVALVQAQSSFQVPRTWGLALTMSLLAGALYALTTVLARLLTPWSSSTQTVGSTPRAAQTARTRWARALSATAFTIASIAVIIAAWYASLKLFNLNGYFAKTPGDVWNYLLSGSGARAHRHELFHQLLITLGDAGIGYVVGTLVAILAAIAIVSVRVLEQVVTPVAIVLRSIPIVAMTPLLALIFGRGLAGVTIIVSLVVFFPTLVNMVMGLRSAPTAATDVIRATGGTMMQAVRMVHLPYALPALFASARIAVPGALGGATLAEWLATGKGMGSLLVISYSNSEFDTLWSGSVLIVAASILLYTLVSALEIPVLNRYSPQGSVAE